MVRLLALRTMLVILAAALAAGCGGAGPSGPGNPVIAAGVPPSGATGVAYPGYSFIVASGGAAPFTWSETGALPPGLSLSSTGQLTGTPTSAATYPITVVVTDSSNPALTGTQPVSLKIDDSTIVVSPATSIPAGVATNPYAGFVFSVASGGSPPFTWTVTTNTPPPGLSLAGSGSLTGTPTSAGSYTFTVTVTDSASPAGTGLLPVTVVVSNPAAPLITPNIAPPAATIGSPYSFQFSASGGFLPLIWAVTSGSLPAGLTLAANGMLTGTPTSLVSLPFTVTVTESASTPRPNSAQFTIAVSNPPPPAINNTPPSIATVGVPYSFQFTATGGLAPLVWSAGGLQWGLGVSLNGDLSGTPSSAGYFPITVDVRDALMRNAPTALFTVRIALARPALTFTPTGSMNLARSGHTATLLNTGKVLVTGGADASAELYNPSTEMFTATGSMTEARAKHAATLLNDAALPNYGKVLIVGPADATAELYDPSTEMFTATGPMTTARTQPVATLLNSGKVLVVGGNTVAGDLTAELYDPSTGTFTATGSMTTARTRPTATLLSSGQVLVTGGAGAGSGATAELYDPSTGTFTATGSMTIARAGHAATRLQDGTVLIVGTEATADLYDPSIGTFSPVGNPFPLMRANGHTATLHSDGTVIVTGGYGVESLYGRYVSIAGICTRSQRPGQFPVSSGVVAQYAPEIVAFMPATGGISPARDGGHTATVLPDGSVLIVGGTQHTVGSTGPPRCTTPVSIATALSSAELIK